MSKFLWVAVEKAASRATHPVYHIVLDADQSLTLCGLGIPDSEGWRVVESLGPERPCDNCTEIAARHEDAGDQPEPVPA